jgi:hypothetical protein
VSVNVATVTLPLSWPAVNSREVPVAVRVAPPSSATTAVEVACAVLPPTSRIATWTWYDPVCAYVFVPVTSKPPPGSATMAPADVWPSPQVIVAVKSSAVLNGLASVNRATSFVKPSPGPEWRFDPVADSGASATLP